MRGIYTAGSLLALHTMGLSRVFDDVYGTSAGAVNAAHFLSGDGHLKVDTYYRLLSDKRFLNRWRFWKIADIDYFTDEVLARTRPLLVDRVMASPTRLWVSVGDFISAKPQLFHAQSGNHPLLKILKAAVAMPIVYNKLIALGNAQGFDAGFFNPFPLREAIAHRCTHVAVLLTQPATHRCLTRTWMQRLLFDCHFARGNQPLSRLFVESSDAVNQLLDLAHGRAKEQPARISIATLSPIAASVGSTTQERDKLRAALVQTAKGTLQLFGESTGQIDDWLKAGVI